MLEIFFVFILILFFLSPGIILWVIAINDVKRITRAKKMLTEFNRRNSPYRKDDDALSK